MVTISRPVEATDSPTLPVQCSEGNGSSLLVADPFNCSEEVKITIERFNGELNHPHQQISTPSLTPAGADLVS